MRTTKIASLHSMPARGYYYAWQQQQFSSVYLLDANQQHASGGSAYSWSPQCFILIYSLRVSVLRERLLSEHVSGLYIDMDHTD